MASVVDIKACGLPSELQVRVFGADAQPMPSSEIARLFPRVPPFSPRFDRLARSSRVVVTCGARVVGLAVYLRTDAELRVPELALAAPGDCARRDVLHALLDALEAACLAGGCRRIVLTPPPTGHATLRRRGYDLVSEGCAGTWMEKSFR